MTQAEAIEQELRRMAGEWVSLPRLHEVSGAYAVHSRVAELRKTRDLVIENRVRRGKGGGPSLSEYRLMTEEQGILELST